MTTTRMATCRPTPIRRSGEEYFKIYAFVHLGNIGKHLSQKQVQAAIRELGRVIDEDRRSSEEGSPPP